MIVADASAVVDVLSAVAGSERLRMRLSGEELHAPALLDYEVVSALRGLTQAAHLSPARAHDAFTDFDDLQIHRWAAHDALRRRAFSLRQSLSAYDAAYVALAEALECPLVTRDKRLARSGGHLAEVIVC